MPKSTPNKDQPNKSTSTTLGVPQSPTKKGNRRSRTTDSQPKDKQNTEGTPGNIVKPKKPRKERVPVLNGHFAASFKAIRDQLPTHGIRGNDGATPAEQEKIRSEKRQHALIMKIMKYNDSKTIDHNQIAKKTLYNAILPSAGGLHISSNAVALLLQYVIDRTRNILNYAKQALILTKGEQLNIRHCYHALSKQKDSQLITHALKSLLTDVTEPNKENGDENSNEGENGTTNTSENEDKEHIKALSAQFIDRYEAFINGKERDELLNKKKQQRARAKIITEEVLARQEAALKKRQALLETRRGQLSNPIIVN